MNQSARHFAAIVLGVSTGGVAALKQLLPALPAGFGLPLLIVIHMTRDSDDGLAVLLDSLSAIRVKEADEGERIEPGVAYLAPADYHLLVGRDRCMALSTDAAVNFARPSIDVLFESAARVYGTQLIGIILTGAAQDGAEGLLQIKQAGGYALVQDPADAEMDSMPRSALARVQADQLFKLQALPQLLVRLTQGGTASALEGL
jgi:two-component system chemotaxis response regulator CheB